MLWKNILLKKFLTECKANDFLDRNVYELALTIVYHVIITNALLTGDALSHLVRFTPESVGYQTEGDSNNALSDAVHLNHLVLLIVDYLVILRWLKFTRHEPKCNIIKKL